MLLGRFSSLRLLSRFFLASLLNVLIEKGTRLFGSITKITSLVRLRARPFRKQLVIWTGANKKGREREEEEMRVDRCVSEAWNECYVL